MNIISGTAYLEIANYYSNAYDSTTTSVTYLFDAVYTIAMLESVLPEVDLLSAFYDSYTINTAPLQSVSLYINAIRTLNNHVLTRGNYASLDVYFAAEGIQVPATWAYLCLQAGYSILPQNII